MRRLWPPLRISGDPLCGFCSDEVLTMPSDRSDRKTKVIFIRCAAATRRALERRAALDNRSLSNYVRLILEKHVAATLTKRPKRKKKGKTAGEFPFAVVTPPSNQAVNQI